MIDGQNDDPVRERAYALWQAAGAPEGDGEQFWHQAERELSEEAGLDVSPADAEAKVLPLMAGVTLAR